MQLNTREQCTHVVRDFYPHYQGWASSQIHAMGYLLQLINAKYKNASLPSLIFCVRLLLHVHTHNVEVLAYLSTLAY